MDGILRVGALRLVPGGASVAGVFTAELREADGVVIGLGSRRATVSGEVVTGESGPQVLVGPLDVDLMGITVHVERFTLTLEKAVAPPVPVRGGRRAVIAGGGDDAC